MTGRYKTYPEYKESGIKFLSGIPVHWATNKVRYISSFSRGLAITKANLQESGVPCVSYGEIHSKFGFEVAPNKHSLKCVSAEYLTSSPYALLSKGDCIFADTSEDIDGSGNFTQLVSDEALFAGYHTIIVRLKQSNYYRFISYLFDSPEFRTQIRDAVKGVKVFSVTQAILKNASVWLPSYEEQQKIANFLDHETAKIDTLISKQEKLIELLKEKRQAVISHAVTKGLNPDAPMKDSGVEWLGEVPEHWEVLQFRRFTHLSQGLQIPQSERFYNTAEGRAEYITIKSINAGADSEFKEYIESSNQRVFCNTNEILLARTGATGEVITNVEGVFHNNFFKVSYDSSYITKDFLFNMLKVKELKAHLLMLAGTTTIPDLNHGAFLSTKVAIPSREEQLLIVNEVLQKMKGYDSVISNAQTGIALLKERKTALISAAVTGKIDVRDLRDWQDSTQAQPQKPPQGVQG